MTRFLVAFALCLLLSGCDGGSPAPAPTPAPVPSPPPVAIMPERRGRKIWEADWAEPDIGAVRGFRDTSPPTLLGEGPWLLMDGPIPDNAYAAGDGTLTLGSGVPGWAMITGRTFPRDAYCSLEWAACARLTSDVTDAFLGIGFYNGEWDYRTLNFMRGLTPGKLALVLLAEPAHTLQILEPDFCDEGSWNSLRMDVEDGVIRLWVNGKPVPIPSHNPPEKDPHVCVFIGGMAARLSRMNMFSEGL